jgi:hypothetical protein
MRRLSIAFALSILLLVSTCSAQTNTITGVQACDNITTGVDNSCYGYQAGFSLTTGEGDSFFGYQAGYNTTTGGIGVAAIHNSNTFFGYQAGFSNTTAGSNAFFGTWAGHSTTGNNNTFLGNQAGESDTTGAYNTFTGTFAGQFNFTGSYNTYDGYQAGGNNTNSNNIFVGYLAGINNVTGTNNIYVGNQGPGSESATTRIGNGQTAAYMAGIFGAISPGGMPVLVNPAGQLGTAPSSLRFKEQVRDMGDSTSGLMKLRPVTFLYKPEFDKGERTLQYGLIAEEVAKVYPELVAYDTEGKPYSVRYQFITTMLLNEVQKQVHRAEAQAELIKAQQQEIEGLKQQVRTQNATLQQRLSRLEALARVEVASAK